MNNFFTTLAGKNPVALISISKTLDQVII